MVKKNAQANLLGQKKAYAKGDTSYSSFWLYNKDRDMKSEHFKDSFVNFYDDEDLLSEFNPTVAKNIISYWSEPGWLILDPFAGRTRAIISHAMGRKYHGFEVDQNVVKYMRGKFKEIGIPDEATGGVVIEEDDCLKISERFSENTVDMVFSCPPYWNLEKYADFPGQLSSIYDYHEFLSQLLIRLLACARALKTGRYMCLVVGDFRKNKRYYSFHSDLLTRMREIDSLALHDIIIVQNIPFYTAAFYFGSRKPYRITSKAHEYLLVWKKIEPPPRPQTSKELEQELAQL